MSSALCWWMWNQRLLWGSWGTGIRTSKSTAGSAGEGIPLGLAWDMEKWKEKRKKKIFLCCELCMLCEWLLLVSEVSCSTLHVFLRKLGSNFGSECFPAQRVYIFSKHVWDTELLFVRSEGLNSSMTCCELAGPIFPLPWTTGLCAPLELLKQHLNLRLFPSVWNWIIFWVF